MKKAFLSLCSLFLLSCSTMQSTLVNPKVEVQSVEMKPENLRDASLVFKLEVENPNSVPLKLDQIEYAIDIEKRPFTTGVITEGLQVEAQSKTLITVPMKISYSDLFTTLSGIISKGTGTYQVRGNAKLGMLKFPFDESGEFSVNP